MYSPNHALIGFSATRHSVLNSLVSMSRWWRKNENSCQRSYPTSMYTLLAHSWLLLFRMSHFNLHDSKTWHFESRIEMNTFRIFFSSFRFFSKQKLPHNKRTLFQIMVSSWKVWVSSEKQLPTPSIHLPRMLYICEEINYRCEHYVLGITFISR